MKPTSLALALLAATALVMGLLGTPASLAQTEADPMTKDTKVTEIISDLKSQYEVLATRVPKQAVIEAEQFETVFGPRNAASLKEKGAQQITIDHGTVHIKLARKVVESGQILSTTLDKDISFAAAGPANNFSMWNIRGVSVKPKSLPVKGASVTALEFRQDCAADTMIQISLSGFLFPSRVLMILAPDGTHLDAVANCSK